MGFVLQKFDKSTFRPVYPKHPVRTEEAFNYVFLLAVEMDDLVVDDYYKIPHAISALYHNFEEIRIDVERTFDENDPYIREEYVLAPPESKEDRFWRRRVTRLTYLTSQIFLALLTGHLTNSRYQFFSHKLVNHHTTREIDLLKDFFELSMAEDPNKRYQNHRDLMRALLLLERQLNLSVYHNMSDIADRKFPDTKRIYIGNQRQNEIPLPENLEISHYQICVWNHLYRSPKEIIVQLPARITVGRKVLSSKGLNTGKREKIDIIPADIELGLEQKTMKKEEEMLYSLLLEGDQCLSRKHLEIYLPSKLKKQRAIVKDLGSTHGLVVFQDSHCHLSNSVIVFPRGKTILPCPEDQYLKLGNTFIRMRPCQKPVKIKEAGKKQESEQDLPV